jgi:c-di-GMP-binding flagellar brake protein YcgR
MRIKDLAVERRKKVRFPINRDVRYKVLEDDTIMESGVATTLDIGSGGVAFLSEHQPPMGAFIELSISWPVLLEDSCPMRLIVFGRVVRCAGRLSASTVDKYEFRTQARMPRLVIPVRTDSMLQRWADNIRKESLKAASA